MKTIKNTFKFLLKHKGKILLFFVVLALAGGYYYKEKHVSSDSKEEVLTEKIRKGDIVLNISKDGAFQAKDSVEVNSKADGRIKEMFVKEGDLVKEGQKLLIVQPGQSEYDKFLPITITSPKSGMVFRCLNERRSQRSSSTYLLPQEGESISGINNGNPTCIMKIVKPGKYVVPVKIDEYDMRYVKLGMPVKLKVISRPGVVYDGLIDFISPQPEVKEEMWWDPNSNKVEFIVVAETKDTLKEIVLGLTATMELALDSKKDVFIVPNSAIYEEKNGDALSYFIYKQLSPKKAKKIEIKLGLKNSNDSEILDAESLGLKDGDVLFLDIDGAGAEIEK